MDVSGENTVETGLDGLEVLEAPVEELVAADAGQDLLAAAITAAEQTPVATPVFTSIGGRTYAAPITYRVVQGGATYDFH